MDPATRPVAAEGFGGTGLDRLESFHVGNRSRLRREKNRLSQLLDRVESGEQITITRYGQPVAMLVPLIAKNRSEIARAFQTFAGIRSALKKRGARASRKDVKKMIGEGRR